ncbi:MAG TPA: hypothetical protein VLF94_07785 [Chlamydiales bacterium]|nr:hypothetical protein [Chlamydiales bacterium]
MFIKMRWLFLCLCFFLEAKEIDTFLGQLLSKSSIVTSRQIKIPDYPNAYNPSLIPYKGGYLLSFRFISKCPEKFRNDFRTDVSLIGVARLDKNFKLSEKTVQLLNITSYSSQFSLTAEDARLLNVGDRILIFFNDLPSVQTSGTFAMYFGELIEERGMFVLKGPAKALNYSRALPIEKNWSPFSSGDRLYMIYSSQPRVILEVDLHTGYCHEVERASFNWHWNLGEIRGGTPACLVNDTFLTFFHSCFPAKIPKGRAYVMGAYTFDKDPPFSVRTLTPRPLGDLADYTQDNASKVVFPGGLVVQDRWIHVAWGKADKQIFITTFDREKLLASMEPCSE